MPRPLPVFGSHLGLAKTAGVPRHVRVFEQGRFLYASFDFGREQVIDLRAHDRVDLLQYWYEWTRPAPPIPRPQQRQPERHERTPERPAQESHDEPPGQFLTSIGSATEPEQRPKRRMTLEEFLVS